MLFSFNLYSSLLLIFFVHILVYATMLMYRGVKQERLSDKLMSVFLLLAALSVVPWMTGFAGWYDGYKGPYREILFYTPFVHGLFMGPLLYFYVKSITNVNFRLQKAHWLHFIPGFIYLIWCLVIVVVDKFVVHRYYLMNGETDPDFEGWYRWLQNISILVYLVLSIRFYKQYKKYVWFEFSFSDMANLSWLRNFMVAFAVITLLPLLQEALELIPFFDNLDYIGSWYYFFSFALVVYYISINSYNADSIPLQKLKFQPELLLQYQSAGLLPAAQTITEEADYQVLEEEKVPSAEMESWKQKVTAVMKDQKLYEDAELTLTQLSKKLSTNTSLLSKIINTGFGKNFNDFVNEYRVNAFTEKLRAGEHQTQTLLSLAFDCGFNSKATFNRAFKKQTGMNPKEWLEKQS